MGDRKAGMSAQETVAGQKAASGRELETDLDTALMRETAAGKKTVSASNAAPAEQITDTVWMDEEKCALVIIDQTKLPGQLELLELTEAKEIYEAIYLLKVRGAPAIGVSAAIGLYVLAARSEAADEAAFLKACYRDCDYLCSARPTAVNLAWALQRMIAVLERVKGSQRMAGTAGGESQPESTGGSNREKSGEEVVGAGKESIAGTAGEESQLATIDGVSDREKGGEEPFGPGKESTAAEDWRARYLSALKEEALAIYREDIEVCRRIGENGLTLLKDGVGILTHCNAGRLATVRYGTATAPIYLAKEQGMDVRVYCDETRPILQGARLTAYELSEAGVDTTLICDNMSAHLMRQGKIDLCLVGCDRVAANGDTANKIGTSVVAAVAKRYGVPLYVCAPTSTIDMATPTGDDIVIEYRPSEEVTDLWYEKPMAPRGVKVLNPAFDITDHRDIAGFITEKGIFKNPVECIKAE